MFGSGDASVHHVRETGSADNSPFFFLPPSDLAADLALLRVVVFSLGMMTVEVCCLLVSGARNVMSVRFDEEYVRDRRSNGYKVARGWH